MKRTRECSGDSDPSAKKVHVSSEQNILTEGTDIELLWDLYETPTWLPATVTKVELERKHEDNAVITISHHCDGTSGEYCLVNGQKLYDIVEQEFVEWRPCENLTIEFDDDESLESCVEVIISEIFVNVLASSKEKFDQLPYRLQIELGKNVLEAKTKLVNRTVALFAEHKTSDTLSQVSKDEIARVITEALEEIV